MIHLETLQAVHHANFFPFGLKDYKISRVMRNLPRHSITGTTAWWALAAFQKILYQFQGLALVSAVFLIFGAGASAREALSGRDFYGGSGALLGILLMMGVLLLAAESFISYVVLGSYGAAFHRLNVRRKRIIDEAARPSILIPPQEKRNLAVIEMKSYAGTFLTAFLVMSATTYFISMKLGGFQDLGSPEASVFVNAPRLFEAVFDTVNIAGGSTEGTPLSMLAKSISMIGTITYLLLTVIVLAALAGVAITGPDDPGQV